MALGLDCKVYSGSYFERRLAYSRLNGLSEYHYVTNKVYNSLYRYSTPTTSVNNPVTVSCTNPTICVPLKKEDVFNISTSSLTVSSGLVHDQ
jgi:hypothetical protein